MLNLPLSFDPVFIKRGFDLVAAAESVIPDNFGSIHIEMKEVERLEVSFDVDNPPSTPFRKGGEEKMDVRKGGEYVRYSGYQIVGSELRPLPIGSTLDPKIGTFSWMPGPGFLGTYDLVFVGETGFGIAIRSPVTVTIKPKF